MENSPNTAEEWADGCRAIADAIERHHIEYLFKDEEEGRRALDGLRDVHGIEEAGRATKRFLDALTDQARFLFQDLAEKELARREGMH